jgi:phage shock protein A
LGYGLLSIFLWRRRMNDPERLIDAVITDMRRKLTEARLQLLAADLARKQAPQTSEELDRSYEVARQGIAELQDTFGTLEERRSVLIARARDADARLAIERALMEADTEPAQVALDMLSERVSGSEVEADAVAEVRRVTTNTGGADGE